MSETRERSAPVRKPRRRRKQGLTLHQVTHKSREWARPKSIQYGEGLAAIVGRSQALAERTANLSEQVQFTVATRTVSGEPLQAQRGKLNPDNFEQFRPRADAQQQAIERLTELGFTVIRRGRFGVTVSGPAELVSRVIGEPLVLQARARPSPLRSTRELAASFDPPRPADLFLAPGNSVSLPAPFSDAIDNVVFTPPPIYHAPPNASAPAYTFQGVGEADLRRLLKAPAGLDGTGIKVGMVDTGFYPHPYYSSRGLALKPTATSSQPKPAVDDYGHGTAMAYNVFATAPKAELLGFKQTDPPQDALEEAADHGCDIITCSWGWDREQIFPIIQATLLDIIKDGKIVIFSAGNGHYSWPASEPTVIAVGGVFWDGSPNLQASNYASGFMSSAFPNRRVPDICGLCGQLPKAIYIMLPTQPGNTMDRANGGPNYPEQDQSTGIDGWVGASGTSAAAPQIAGVAALLLQKARGKGIALTNATLKALLEQTAVSVQAGANAMGIPAVGQPNTATGFGLVDATAAAALI